MLKIADGELLNEAVTSILWRFIIKNEKTNNKEIRLLHQSQKLSFHEYLNSWTAEWEKNHYNQGVKWRLIKCPRGKSFPPKLVNKDKTPNTIPTVELLGFLSPFHTQSISLTLLFSNVWKSFSIIEVSLALSGKETEMLK